MADEFNQNGYETNHSSEESRENDAYREYEREQSHEGQGSTDSAGGNSSESSTAQEAHREAQAGSNDAHQNGGTYGSGWQNGESYGGGHQNGGAYDGSHQNGNGSYNNGGTHDGGGYQNGGAYNGGYQNGGAYHGGSYQNGNGYANGNNSYATGNGNYQYSDGYNNYYAGPNGGNQNHGNGGRRGGHKKSGGVLKALLVILLAIIFGICAGVGAYGISRVYGGRDVSESNTQEAVEEEHDDGDEEDGSSTKENANKADLQLLTGDEIHTAVTDVAASVMPSIVSVYNTYTAQSQDFWGQVYSQEATSTGSGIIIANTGDELLIATNNHVIDDADSLEVQFIDETTAAANLKGTDAGDDLAVIAVSLDDLDEDTLNNIAVATLGSSDDLVIGEPVVAIGNALGYGQSVTTGVVSALNRELTNEDGETGTYIQTDAAINPGNSGGALVDLNGNVIGINSNKIGGTTVEGMGYAIPMSKAEPIIERLASQDTKTKVADGSQGYLGIAGVSVTSQVSSAYNMPQGAYVAEIYDGTGAAKSDLQKGDIITAVNGSSVASMTDLQDELTYYEAGTTVTLTIQRADGSGEYSEQDIELTLTSADEMPSSDEQQSGNGGNGGNNGQGGQGGYYGGFYQYPWGNGSR